MDTLDRFTRNLRDGLNLLEQLRGHGVKLIPLDSRRVVDIDEDYGWRDVVEEFTAAEWERRKIRRRVIRSYEGRRERGATTSNKVPLGVRKDGDRLVPSDDSWLAAEIDRRVLAGESRQSVVRWIRSVHAKGWKSATSLRRMLVNPAYEAAGVRSAEDAAKLRVLDKQLGAQFGEKLKRKYDHEFTGVFRCAACGYRMHSVVGRKGETLVCDRHIDHPSFNVLVDERVRSAWAGYLSRVQTDAFVQEWSGGEAGETAELRRGLQRQIARFDQQASELARRRDRAFDLLVDGDPAIEQQARTMLRKVDADEKTVALQQAAVASELLSLPEPRTRDVAQLRELLRQFRNAYDLKDVRKRNRWNRMLCAMFDSNPVIARVGYRKIAISWPELDAAVATDRNTLAV